MAQPAKSYVEPSQDSSVVPEYATATAQAATNARLGNVEDLTRAILLIVVVSFGAIVVGAIAIILDQLHFNNELYRDGPYNHSQIVQEPGKTTNITQTTVFPNLKPKN